MSKPTAFLLAGMIFCQSGVVAAADKNTWDISRNFSAKHNPNGVSKYFGNGTLFNTPSDPCGDIDSRGCPDWNNGQGEPDGAGAMANNTGQVITGPMGGAPITIYLPPGYVNLDPQSGVTTVTWAAPESATYAFNGNFLGIDTGIGSQSTHYVHIALLGSQAPLYDASINSYGQSAVFSFQMTLGKGQSLAFSVQAGSFYGDLSTGLALQITEQ